MRAHSTCETMLDNGVLAVGSGTVPMSHPCWPPQCRCSPHQSANPCAVHKTTSRHVEAVFLRFCSPQTSLAAQLAGGLRRVAREDEGRPGHPQGAGDGWSAPEEALVRASVAELHELTGWGAERGVPPQPSLFGGYGPPAWHSRVGSRPRGSQSLSFVFPLYVIEAESSKRQLSGSRRSREMILAFGLPSTCVTPIFLARRVGAGHARHQVHVAVDAVWTIFAEMSC